MNKRYEDTPINFAELEPYVTIETEEIVRAVIQTEKCYFYDTCAFRNHAMVSHPEFIFEYIKKTGGIVVITRCIMIELCSGDKELWNEHIEYIKKMSQYGIQVLIMDEEETINILNACYSGIPQMNGMLSFAVKTVKSKAGTIESVLNNNRALKRDLLIEYENQDSSLAERFFKEVRENKSPQDNLGEELIAVCIHLLSNIMEMSEFKYILFTDDRGAITLLGKVMHNVEQHIKRKCISGITTAKLCWLMVLNNIVSKKEQIQDIIKSGNIDDSIKVYCSEKFELSPGERTMSIEEFAEKLINSKELKIYL